MLILVREFTRGARLLVALFVLSSVVVMLPAIAGAVGFTPTGNMLTPRNSHTATLLQDGKVLIVGGTNGETVLTSAELYDPATGQFLATGPLTTARRHHTATLMTNGKVLITGGDNSARGSLNSAELYNPQTGTFSPTVNMKASRTSHAATRLQNGKVLISGGEGIPEGENVAKTLGSAELYDPTQNTFTRTAGVMVSPSYNHTATLLQNGKVLLAGGRYDGEMFSGSSSGAELYNPATDTFTQTGLMVSSRRGHTATLLANGKVLIVGGSFESSGWCMGCGPMSSAEVYDPASGSFSATGSMNVERTGHAATRLSNGKILIAGGWAPFFSSTADEYAELYDPTAGTFIANAPLPAGAGCPATLLSNDKVLVAGTVGAALLYSYVDSITLTVTSTGGAADITPDPKDVRQRDITDTPVMLTYLQGTTVNLVASEFSRDFSLSFLGWNGCDAVIGTQCTVTMDGNRTVSADYAPLRTVTVTTSQDPLAVDVDGVWHMTPATFYWVMGSVHAIGAPSPQSSPDNLEYYFNSWSDGGEQWHAVSVTSDQVLTASFVANLLPARIMGAYFPTIFDAYNAASNGAVIEAQTATFEEDLTLSRGIDISIIGGYDTEYSGNQAGMTTVRGNVTIETGSLAVDRLIVR
jgi:hypothetical protein